METLANILTVVGLVLLALFVASVFSFLIAFPIMWLWNFVMPDLFHFPVISYWQSWALLMLSTLLFRPMISEKK